MASTTIPPQVLQASAYAAHEEVMNRRSPDIFDRKKMPWWSFLKKHTKERHFTRGKVIQKLQRAGGLTLQHWARREVLRFQETFIDDEMVWTPYRSHIGLEIVHTDLEDRGFTVMPNEERGRNFPTKISRAEGDVLMDYFAQQIEDMEDSWDVQHDQELLTDNSSDAQAPVGLDALLPLDNTTGTIAGKSRSDELFRHVVVTGSTTGASGTLERDLNTGVRLAEENGRGMPSSIDFIMAGDDWVDAYVAYAKANGLRYQRPVDEASGVDIGMPDTRLEWNGIPIVRNPTFRVLARLGLYTGTSWAKRAYFLASRTWELAYQKGKMKHFSAPMDPSDQRLSRLSLDGRHALICKKPNGQFVSTIS